MKLLFRCPVDPTVRFYNSPSGSARFSITSFQFLNSKSRSFFSHCDVLVCDKNDDSEQCNRQCKQQPTANEVKSRKRRSTFKLTKRKNGMYGTVNMSTFVLWEYRKRE